MRLPPAQISTLDPGVPVPENVTVPSSPTLGIESVGATATATVGSTTTCGAGVTPVRARSSRMIMMRIKMSVTTNLKMLYARTL